MRENTQKIRRFIIMKKQSKILAVVAAIVACLAMAAGLSACSGGSAEVKDVYSKSAPGFTEVNIQVDLINTSSTDLVLYSDGSYQLIEKKCSYMKAYKSSVSTVVTISCGTYTFTAGEFEDTATIKLDKATRIIYNECQYSSAVYRDTADATTLPEGTTAEAYLETNAKEYTLTVNPQNKTITAGIN